LKFSPKSCRFTYLNPRQGGYFVDPLVGLVKNKNAEVKINF
jgi:hypothetical protein